MAQYMTQQGYVTSSLQKAKTRARQEAEDYGRSYVENTESGTTVYRTNPRQPHKRVRKALKKYVKRQTKNPVGLPTQYTPAKVRVNPKGGLDIKFARPPKGATRNPRGFSVTANRNPAWTVTLHGKKIDTIFDTWVGPPSAAPSAADVKRSLVKHDGYDPAIKVTKERKRK